ncbi:unnamed protein product, partial [Timema podura]|nr:unnamed protein product [Timema podura]
IPGNMLPKVCDTAADFGVVDPGIFGTALAIRCSMADQAASLFGSCCFQEGDVKVTMGTGTFINLNTGKTPHASIAVHPTEIRTSISPSLAVELNTNIEGQSRHEG